MNLENSKIKAPFTVPEGYFPGLEERLLSGVKISVLSELRRPAVPEGYFDTLEEQLLSTTRLAPLNGTPGTPEGYFDALEEQILSRVKIDGLKRPAVEKGYFEGLEDRIMAEARLQDLPQASVPAGYFDTLEKDILAKTTGARKEKFTLFRNSKVMRSAAAVAVIGLVAYGLSWNNPAPKDELAGISSDAMIAYLREQPLMEEDLNFVLDGNEVFLTSEVSDKEITSYLLENGINI